MRTLFLFLTSMLLFSMNLTAEEASAPSVFPEEARVPGGTAVINLGYFDELPDVSFNGNPVWLYRTAEGNVWAAMGIPLSQTTGEAEYLVNDKAFSFQVRDKKYREQHLTVSRKHSNPDTSQLKRITRESKRSKEAFRQFSAHPTSGRFIWPVSGPISSPFGLKRFFNEQPRRPHSGIDIAAARGTPIVAPAAGKVILTGNLFFNGNTVFIDHGNGLVTMYCHMDSIDVKQGNLLSQGEVFGTIGSTGRATGPHLHWTVSLNTSPVDPMLFIAAGDE